MNRWSHWAVVLLLSLLAVSLAAMTACGGGDDDDDDDENDTGDDDDDTGDDDTVGDDDDDDTGPEDNCFADEDFDGFGDPDNGTYAEGDCPEFFVTDDTDCNDADPLTHPGAVEFPDDGIDQDCDGSDLNASDDIGVFVSADTGADGAAGTMADPLKKIADGIAAAESAGKSVFVAAGTGDYAEKLTATVSLFGGYDASDWSRDIEANETTVSIDDDVVLTIAAAKDGPVILDGFTVENTGTGSMIRTVRVEAEAIVSNNAISGGNGSTNCWTLMIDGADALVVGNEVDGGSGGSTVAFFAQWGDVLAYGNVFDGGTGLDSLGVIAGSEDEYVTTLVLVENDIDSGVGVSERGMYLAGDLTSSGKLSVTAVRNRINAAKHTAAAPSENIGVEVNCADANVELTLVGNEIAADPTPPDAETGVYLYTSGASTLTADIRGNTIGAAGGDDSFGVVIEGQNGGTADVRIAENGIECAPGDNDAVGIDLVTYDGATVDLVVDRNVVTFGSGGGADREAVVINDFQDDGNSTFEIANNFLVAGATGDASSIGIHVRGGSTDSGSSAAWIVGNTIVAGDAKYSVGVDLRDMDATLVNNVIAVGEGDESYGIDVSETPSLVTLIQNDVWGADPDCMLYDNTTTPVCIDSLTELNNCAEWSGCTESSGNMSEEPGFVSSTDWHLAFDSECIDAGVDPASWYTGALADVDIDGDARPQGEGFDIGADERSAK